MGWRRRFHRWLLLDEPQPADDEDALGVMGDKPPGVAETTYSIYAFRVMSCASDGVPFGILDIAAKNYNDDAPVERISFVMPHHLVDAMRGQLDSLGGDLAALIDEAAGQADE